MNGQWQPGILEADGLDGFRAAAAEDLRSLANLHAKALERDVIITLWGNCYDGLLGLQMHSDEVRKAINLFCRGLTDIPTYLDKNSLDTLSTAYLDIYVNGAIGAFPCESVWHDQENWGEQESTRGIGEWQQGFGFASQDSFAHSPDHLVSQLQFVAYLLATTGATAPFGDTLRYLDEHLMYWIDRFAERVCERSKIRWYQGLAALTAAYLHELRTMIAQLDSATRPEGLEMTADMGRSRDFSTKPGALHASTRPTL